MAEYIEREALKRHIERHAQLGVFERRYISLVIDERPAADVVPVEVVAQMLRDSFGDKCACNYNGTDEWLPSVCEYEAEGKCPDPEDELGCWKQFIKHFAEREVDQ